MHTLFGPDHYLPFIVMAKSGRWSMKKAAFITFCCGLAHEHTHAHNADHVHAHAEEGSQSITPWVLFTIFVFGPCEPLIPLLMYPAAQKSLWGLAAVSAVFGAVTLTTMMTVVLVSAFGVSFIPLSRLERYTHALAGATICICGLSIEFLGL